MDDDQKQASLLDLSGREFNPNWVDPSQPLFVPNNPLHFKAHKLQLYLARLDNQMVNAPQQFNGKNYQEALDALTECWTKINAGEVDDSTGSQPVAEDGHETAAPAVGERVLAGVGAGVSSDNPFAG